MFSSTGYLNFFNRLSRKARKRKFRKEISKLTLQERFSRIYSINYWNHAESLSGAGSTIEYTENLRSYLPNLINELNIKTVFDGPCGDFNWMQYVLRIVNVQYIGGDIVPTLIERNKSLYSSENVSFLQIDLTEEIFPKVDLMICRDCLFHLSYNDTKKLLNNFIRSEIKYFLTTTYANDGTFENADIISGRFRFIDLHSAPYYFPSDVISEVEDWIYPDKKRYMRLWSRDQIMKVVMKHFS